jgi:hypothetical protein
MRVVVFGGQKGGVGKTTNSHAAAHGLTLLGIPSAYVLTDRRALLSDETRVYTVIDGRTVSQLEQAVGTARGHNGPGVLVIDGGGNREAVDELLSSVADLVFLPFGASDDDVLTVAEDMSRYPKAWALPSNWPANAKAKAIDKGYVSKLAELYPERVLRPPLYATHSIRDLILQDFNGLLLPPAAKYCKALARLVVDLLPR